MVLRATVLAVLLAVSAKGCTPTQVPAVPGTVCAGVAAPAGQVVPIVFAPLAPNDTLRVYVAAYNMGSDGKKIERFLPICVKYEVSSNASMEALGGLAQLKKLPVQASTSYSHPIGFNDAVPFHLVVTATYIGKDVTAIGATLACGIDSNHYRGPTIIEKITRDNFNTQYAHTQCEYENPIPR